MEEKERAEKNVNYAGEREKNVDHFFRVRDKYRM